MRLWIPLAVAAVLLFPSRQAGSEAVTVAESRIVAVTVFPDRAEVTREAAVEVPAGKSLVVLEGLPATLFPRSLRVRTTAGQSLRIGSVEAQRVFAQEVVQSRERALVEQIEALLDRRRLLEDQVKALGLQLEFIKALGREGPRTALEEVGRGALAPETWREAWTVIGGGAKEALDGIRAAELEQRAIDREVEQKRRELNQVRTGRKSNITARVQVEAAAPETFRLSISYQLLGAAWRPLYDARLDTERETLAITQIGAVTQRTGEDWTGVQLALSTARPSGSAQMPELDTWFLDFRPEPAPITRRSVTEQDAGEARQARAKPDADLLAELAEQPLEAPAPIADVVASEFAAVYRIAGLASVAADNAPRSYVIAEHELGAELKVRTVPKFGSRAYLFAVISHPGTEPWLPGPVSIFRDGSFVGSLTLDFLRPGEKHKLSFGVDDKVRVGFRLQSGERSREGLIEKNRRVERRYLIELENLHQRAIEVTALDQLPVPRDERIAVELLSDSTAPSQRDLDRRKGVLAWTRTLQPGQTDRIRFGYAVTYPETENLPGF